MAFKDGEVRVLYILSEGDYVPVGCLTSNNLEETVEMIDTTTRESGKWSTSIPSTQSYNIPFEAVQEHNDNSILSYTDLKVLKRARTKIQWEIRGGGLPEDSGYGYITDLNESNSVGEFLLFSGNIRGYGEPVLVLLVGDIYQNGNEMIFQNGNEITFNI